MFMVSVNPGWWWRCLMVCAACCFKRYEYIQSVPCSIYVYMHDLYMLWQFQIIFLLIIKNWSIYSHAGGRCLYKNNWRQLDLSKKFIYVWAFILNVWDNIFYVEKLYDVNDKAQYWNFVRVYIVLISKSKYFMYS